MSADLGLPNDDDRPAHDPKPQGPLARVPAEVLDAILANLPLGALAASLRVSQLFYTRGLPQLYRDVEIGSSKVAPWSALSRSPHSSPTSKRQCRLRTLQPPPSNLVRHLTVLSHPSWACHPSHRAPAPWLYIPPLHQLSVLRIFLTRGRIHAEENTYYRSPSPPQQTCAVLPPARKLVLRNVPLLYEPLARNLLPQQEGVDHAVVVLEPDVALVGTNMKWEVPGAGALGVLAAIPPGVRLTLVFFASMGEVWRPQPRPHRDDEDGLRPPEAENGSFIAASWVGRFCVSLADALTLHDIRGLTLVNAAAIDPASVLPGVDASKPSAAVGRAVEEFLMRCVRERKGQGVKCITIEEFLGSEDAEGVFDPSDLDKGSSTGGA